MKNTEQNYGTKAYPSFWRTITQSKEWNLWRKEQQKRFRIMCDRPIGEPVKGVFDIDESYECGWMSPRHWNSFIKFIRTIK